MENIAVKIDRDVQPEWAKLPIKNREALASRILNAALKGSMYPTGSEQLELAIELAEAGVDAETISTLTRLKKEVFEAFVPK